MYKNSILFCAVRNRIFFLNARFKTFFLGQGNSNHNAFYAYMSTNLQYPHPDRTFVFDTVRTNVGSGYSNSSGLFTAPHAGTFVFAWTVVVDATSFVFSELSVNNVAMGELIFSRNFLFTCLRLYKEQKQIEESRRFFGITLLCYQQLGVFTSIFKLFNTASNFYKGQS